MLKISTPGAAAPARGSWRHSGEWLFLVFAATLLGAYVGQTLYADYRRIGSEETARLENLAKVIDQNLSRQLVAVDEAIDFMRDDVSTPNADKSRRAQINRRMQTTRAAIPGVRTMIFAGPDGVAIASNRAEMIGQRLFDREYFQIAYRGGNPDVLYLSPPFKTVLGVYAINAVTVIFNGKGKFGGAIWATLDPEYFDTLLSSVLYAPDMLASLIHGDGKVVFRVPDPQRIAGIDLATPGSAFTQHVRSARPTSVFLGTAAATGEDRLTVLHTINPASARLDKALIIALSRERSGLYGSWRKEAYQQGGLLAIIVITAAISLAIYLRRQRAFARISREFDAQRKKVEAQLRITATVFESQEGMLIADADGLILQVNHAFADISGYTADEIVGARTKLFKSSFQDEAFCATVSDALAGNGRWQGEIRNRRKSGAVFSGRLTITAVRNDCGATTHYVATLTDITQRLASEERVRYLAHYDALTNLPNRALLLDRLRQALALARRDNKKLALMFVDLDKFKPVNDTFGHEVGDLLLREVALRAQVCLRRESDTMYRLGGDEFVIMLVQIDEQEDVFIVAEKVLAVLRTPFEIASKRVEISCSIGIAVYPQHGGDEETLLRSADQAMYQAKAGGRDCCRCSGV